MHSFAYKLFIALIAVLAISASCEMKPTRLDDYFVEFATVVRDDGATTFRLDNGKSLIPKEWQNTEIKSRQRVILNYTPLDNKHIKINRVDTIFSEAVRMASLPMPWMREPVKIQSIWVGGEYLNMILEIDYHSTVRHQFAVYASPLNPTTLFFVHSRNENSPGYPQKVYLSFSLKTLLPHIDSDSFKFTLSIYTNQGLRTIEYTYK